MWVAYDLIYIISFVWVVIMWGQVFGTQMLFLIGPGIYMLSPLPIHAVISVQIYNMYLDLINVITLALPNNSVTLMFVTEGMKGIVLAYT